MGNARRVKEAIILRGKLDDGKTTDIRRFFYCVPHDTITFIQYVLPLSYYECRAFIGLHQVVLCFPHIPMISWLSASNLRWLCLITIQNDLLIWIFYAQMKIEMIAELMGYISFRSNVDWWRLRKTLISVQIILRFFAEFNSANWGRSCWANLVKIVNINARRFRCCTGGPHGIIRVGVCWWNPTIAPHFSNADGILLAKSKYPSIGFIFTNLHLLSFLRRHDFLHHGWREIHRCS